jgi:hypothetical protein
MLLLLLLVLLVLLLLALQVQCHAKMAAVCVAAAAGPADHLQHLLQQHCIHKTHKNMQKEGPIRNCKYVLCTLACQCCPFPGS